MANSALESSPFRLGRFLVQPELRTLNEGETTIHLEPKVMNVLLVLADRAGHVVPRQEFYDRVWPNAVVGDEVLSRCIYQLRTYFGDNSRTQKFILTVPKHGYKLLVAPTATAMDDENAGDKIQSVARPRWPVRVALAGLALTAIILVTVYSRAPQVTNSTRPSVAAATDPPGIVVIPYSDLSRDGNRRYFSEGITEDLLIGLGQIDGLRVIGRESAARLMEHGTGPAEIGATLNVDAMLTGSVRFDGDRLRVSNRLIDTKTGEQLWSESFEGTVQDIFDIEDKITRSVVTELQIRLVDEISELRVRRATENDQAYKLYLEGHYYLNQRSSGALKQSIDFFNQALAADPEFPLAYSCLADAHMLLSQYGDLAREEATLVAVEAIDAALNIDPDLAEAHASRGLVLLHNERYDEATTSLRTAAALNPGYMPAHLWLGRALDLQSQFSQGLAAYRRALELDPLSPIANMNVSRMLTLGGRTSEADERLEVAIRYGKDFANLYWARGYNEYLRGNLENAAVQFNNAIEFGLTDEVQIYALLALIDIDLGEFDAAERHVASAERVDTDSYLSIIARYQLMLAREEYAELERYLLAIAEQLPHRQDIVFRAASLAVWQGNIETALELFDRGLADSTNADLLYLWDYSWGSLAALDLAHAYKETGQLSKQEMLLDMIDTFIQEQADRGIATPPTHYVRAVWHAQRNELDVALRELALAKSSGWSGIWLARSDPRIASLRAMPEFRELLSDLDTT